MDKKHENGQAAHAKIIAKAWSDPVFKAKLLADPHKVLTDAGIVLKPGVTVKVIENTDSEHHLVLPAKQTSEMSDADLDKVAGGTPVCIGIAIAALVVPEAINFTNDYLHGGGPNA